jgi:ArsR family transcriptional regulator
MMIELPVASAAGAADVSAPVASFLRLMADPTRRRIFLLLMGGETCNCELSERLGLAQNLVSHHLRQLREAGLISERRDAADARWIYYSVQADALSEVWGSLESLFAPANLGARQPVCPPPEDAR